MHERLCDQGQLDLNCGNLEYDFGVYKTLGVALESFKALGKKLYLSMSHENLSSYKEHSRRLVGL